MVAACEPEDPNAPRGAQDPISSDTSQLDFSGGALFTVSLLEEASLTIYVENRFPGHLLKAIEIECDLFLKDGRLAQTNDYRVGFYPPIPSGGGSQGEAKVWKKDLLYHLDDYSKGPRMDMCRLVGAESIKRDLVTNRYVSVTDIECSQLTFAKTQYRLKNSHPTETVTSVSAKCWDSSGVLFFRTQGDWSDSGALRRRMAPIGEVLPPSSEEWLESETTSCPTTDPIICSVTAEF